MKCHDIIVAVAVWSHNSFKMTI